MPDIVSLIQQGSSNLLIFIPIAILLGALHGLEPGHSKTMMAAFIVAIRGTVKQAALLGLAATFSHSMVVWIVAVIGMYFMSGKFDAESTEPYFQMVSGLLMVAIAAWMVYRSFKHHQDFLHHHHHKLTKDLKVIETVSPEYQDAHELAHAKDIRHRFTNKNITTSQIVMFGLTGGLIPCPASITVLLLCLQLKKIAMGALLVFCFSIGLALVLVASGVVAALSIKQASKRWSGFSKLARRAPYLSGMLIAMIGLYVAYHGFVAIGW